ncbi:MAG TPA: nucleotide disphospho-sugar-binding domain-containing protein, partial [Gaiellaceae bacterium]|nr:nucleotide disphospho-sugar-binding domain-containing protein [Gaiellaceae bacterium]
VLGHAAAVVGHGGAGTTLGALAAGVPLVVVPLFADQPWNAARVAAVGAGIVAPVDGIRAAVERVLGEESYAAAERRVAAEMREHPHVDEYVAERALRG